VTRSKNGPFPHDDDDMSDSEHQPFVDLLLRKSRIVREGERALSIRSQEELGRRWADENGYRVRKVWAENLSAWSDVDRPKMDAALSAVLHGDVSALWCYAMDRFSRKGAEAVVPVLGKARVIFDYERLDSMNERDRRWIIDRAEMAREYSHRLSYNVKTTKNRQRNEGRWLSRAPYGLAVDPVTRRLKPDTTPRYCLASSRTEVAPWDVVVRIFETLAKGETSGRALARVLHAEGHVTAHGVPWSGASVRNLVVHPAYEGWLTVLLRRTNVAYLNPKGERVRCVDEAVLPRMISADVATRARAALSGQRIMPTEPNTGLPTHILAGRIRCAGCSGAMVATGSSYNCYRYQIGGHCAAPALVSRPAVESYVASRWLARMEHSEDDDPVMLAAAERWTTLQRPEETQEIREATAAMRSAEAGLDKFHQDDAAGFYEGRSAKYRMPHKREREERLKVAEDRVKELTGGDSIDLGFLRHGLAEETWAKSDGLTRRDLVGIAVEYVTVCKAPGQGHPFNGPARCVITWAEPGGGDLDE